MRKTLVVLLLFIIVGLSACSQYTCATYASKEVKKTGQNL